MAEKRTKNPKYTHTMRRKNGAVVCYYRKPGCVAIPLPLPVGTPEFMAAYEDAEFRTRTLVKRRRTATLHPASAVRLANAVKETMADCGIYLLIEHGKVVYVGTSKNCGARIAEHRRNGRSFDRAYYIFSEGNDREWLEAILIRQLNPIGNKRQMSAHSDQPSASVRSKKDEKSAA